MSFKIRKRGVKIITIGEKIKESRKTKNLTQQNLADKLNVSRSAV